MGKTSSGGRRPATPIAAGPFFAIATVLTAAAGASLLAPDGALDVPLGAPSEGALGVTVAAVIVWWLTRPRVRDLFR